MEALCLKLDDEIFFAKLPSKLNLDDNDCPEFCTNLLYNSAVCRTVIKYTQADGHCRGSSKHSLSALKLI